MVCKGIEKKKFAVKNFTNDHNIFCCCRELVDIMSLLETAGTQFIRHCLYTRFVSHIIAAIVNRVCELLKLR